MFSRGKDIYKCVVTLLLLTLNSIPSASPFVVLVFLSEKLGDLWRISVLPIN